VRPASTPKLTPGAHPRRFSQLRRHIEGISEKMLAQTVARQVWGLARWVEDNLGDVLAANERYDAARG
jgi:hypothetical protein